MSIGCSSWLRRARLGFRPAARSGFTIVELLVVIGMIGLLMSILIPALSKARQQALSTQCQSNLRTLAQAWLMYASQNKQASCPGRLPTANSAVAGSPGVFFVDSGTQYRPRWYELLGDIVKQYACANPKAIENDNWTIENPLFLCPSQSEWVNSRNYPYGYNYQFLGNPRPREDGKWINWPVKADRIRATETVMAVDCMGTASGKAKLDRTGYHVDGGHDAWAMGNKAYLLDPPRLTVTSDYADPEKRSAEHRSGPDPRHFKRANAAFCDGHIEALAPEDMGYVGRSDGSYTIDGNNRMFSGTGMDTDPPPVR